jgi:hypothetical protein
MKSNGQKNVCHKIYFCKIYIFSTPCSVYKKNQDFCGLNLFLMSTIYLIPQ